MHKRAFRQRGCDGANGFSDAIGLMQTAGEKFTADEIDFRCANGCL